jgi:hypothetical protein
MTTYFMRLLPVVLLAIVVSPTAAEEWFILHPDTKSPQLSAEELKAIFNGRRTIWLDQTTIRLAVSQDGPGMDALSGFLGKSSSQLKYTWKKLLFTGNGRMPEMLRDDAAVVAYVAKTPGSIGMIASKPPGDVTAIAKP